MSFREFLRIRSVLTQDSLGQDGDNVIRVEQ